MTASIVKLIITAEVTGQRVELGQLEIQISEKLDESIYQGMQGMGRVLYGAILEGVDEGSSRKEKYHVKTMCHLCRNNQ